MPNVETLLDDLEVEVDGAAPLSGESYSTALLAEVLNRTKLLEFALDHVQAAASQGSRPSQRQALRALLHTAQVLAGDLKEIRGRALRARLVSQPRDADSSWLDASPARAESAPADPAPRPRATVHMMNGDEEVPRGGESILFVDDDDSVRAPTARFLRQLGYWVQEAHSGDEGLRQLAESPGRLQLLITDLMMPGMHGEVLAARAREVQPSLKVLFVSGTHLTTSPGARTDRLDFLPKPFRPSDLARKIRLLVDETTV